MRGVPLDLDSEEHDNDADPGNYVHSREVAAVSVHVVAGMAGDPVKRGPRHPSGRETPSRTSAGRDSDTAFGEITPRFPQGDFGPIMMPRFRSGGWSGTAAGAALSECITPTRSPHVVRFVLKR